MKKTGNYFFYAWTINPEGIQMKLDYRVFETEEQAKSYIDTIVFPVHFNVIHDGKTVYTSEH